jgi:hypothetical protein
MNSKYLLAVFILTATGAAMPTPSLAAAPTVTEQEQLRQLERERVLREQLQRMPDVRLERPMADLARQRILKKSAMRLLWPVVRKAMRRPAERVMNWLPCHANAIESWRKHARVPTRIYVES